MHFKPFSRLLCNLPPFFFPLLIFSPTSLTFYFFPKRPFILILLSNSEFFLHGLDLVPFPDDSLLELAEHIDEHSAPGLRHLGGLDHGAEGEVDHAVLRTLNPIL